MSCNPSSLSLHSSSSSSPSSSHGFLPDVVLVKEHLLKKVLDHPPSVGFIKEINLYSYNPDQHPCLHRVVGDAEPSYFFVFNKEKMLGHFRLTPDGGNWFLDGKDIKINDGGQTIAFKKRFVFRSNNKNDDGQWLDTPWSMQEYKLNPELEELDNLKDPKRKNWVLCRISKAKRESNEEEGSLKRKHEFDQSNEESSKSVEAKETEAEPSHDGNHHTTIQTHEHEAEPSKLKSARMACNPPSSPFFSLDFLPPVRLVQEYLFKKVFGDPSSVDFIKDIDLYSFNPDQHPCLQRIVGDSKASYFFVLNKEKMPGVRLSTRGTPDGGDWFVYGNDIKIIDDVQTIAFEKRFVFRSKNKNDGKWLDTSWSMQEYRLNPELQEIKNLKDANMKNWVLCRIYKTNAER